MTPNAASTPLERFTSVEPQLNGTSVDLKSVCDPIRGDPILAGRIVQLSRLLAAEPSAAPRTLEEVVVLQGPDRFRMTLLSAALLDLRSRAFFPLKDPALVRHAVLSALSAERLAQRSGFAPAGVAYLMALVHPLETSRDRRVCHWTRPIDPAVLNHSSPDEPESPAVSRSNGPAIPARWRFSPLLTSLLGRQLKMRRLRVEPALAQIVEMACAKACARSHEVLSWSFALEALGN